MNNDLFQISQMHDIYFTMRMWYFLSPKLVVASSKNRLSDKRAKHSYRKSTNPAIDVKANSGLISRSQERKGGVPEKPPRSNYVGNILEKGVINDAN